MEHDLGCSSLNPQSVDFLDKLYRLIIDDVVSKSTDRSTKVLDFAYPEEIEADLDLEVSDSGLDSTRLIVACRKLVKYSVQTGHPRFLNLLYSGLDPAALGASWLTESLNCNGHTFESAPAFIVLENFVIQQLCKLNGFTDGDGFFVPGASFGTFLALHLARFNFNNEVKQKGMFGQPIMCLFCSEDAHYSVAKAGHLLGFGSDNVISVETDEAGRMKPSSLEQAIVVCKNAGKIPLAVTATNGTTVLGAFDSLVEISDVCGKHKVWLHADASWGGGAIFSPRHRHLLQGIERCDSVVVSLHKLLGAQIQCSVLLVRKKGELQACNGTSASYLFQSDKFYDVSYDVGDKTVQCGRKVEAFKFWLMWKSRGHEGMARVVDIAFDNARHLTEMLKLRDGFRLVQPEFQFLNICFWYIPANMRGQPETEEWWNTLHKVAPKIKESMMKKGSLMIAYQPLTTKGLVNFFRLVTGNPATTHADMEFVLDEIDRIGYDLNATCAVTD